MNKSVLIILLVIIVGGGIALAASSDKSPEQEQVDVVVSEETQNEEPENPSEEMDELKQQMIEEETSQPEDTMIEEETSVQVEMEDIKEVGAYIQYGEMPLSEIQGDIVLSFSAAWCPSCQVLKKDIQNNLGDIPSSLTIVEVNYDEADDLKSQYGVRQQHTLVQVSSSGEEIQKWIGGNSLESIIERI